MCLLLILKKIPGNLVWNPDIYSRGVGKYVHDCAILEHCIKACTSVWIIILFIDDLTNVRPCPSLIGHHQLLVWRYMRSTAISLPAAPDMCPCKERQQQWHILSLAIITVYGLHKHTAARWVCSVADVQLPQTTAQSSESCKLSGCWINYYY
jgi:hypothetical protein